MHVVADGRLVRRVVKRYRGVAGIGLSVPHGHVITLPREALSRLVELRELGAAELPEIVVLVARPAVAEVDRPEAEWRASFHGHVHLALDARAGRPDLTEASLRARIDRIGQTEFDEIRAVLAGEDLLFSRRDDREVYIEFVASYLELLHFARDDLPRFFPTLGERARERVEATIAEDIGDAAGLLAASRPSGAGRRESHADHPAREPATTARGPRRLGSPEGARRDGNLARAALLELGAGGAEARERANTDLLALGQRLSTALGAASVAAGDEERPQRERESEAWAQALTPLAESAARSWSPRSLEARVLFDLQKASVEHERERRAVDVVTWATTLGSRPIVRALPMARPVRVARRLHHALSASHRVRLAPDDRRALDAVLRSAAERSRGAASRALLPALTEVLDEVGLRPANVPEAVAREKLCAELVDTILARGSLGLGQLRDALSRSNLKMENLRPRALLTGDALLSADARLSVRLDGVYRRGEIYLRGLQKLSSLAFGTTPGRALTLHALLPVLASFVVLEALQHLAHPIGKRLGHSHVHVRSTGAMIALSVVFYAVLHSATVRRTARATLGAIGSALYAIFFGAPRWVLTRPLVRAALRSAPFTLFSRVVARPLLFAAPAYGLARRAHLPVTTSALIGAAVFVAAAAVFGTSLGARFEEETADLAALGLGNLRRRLLPGLVALALDLSHRAIERVERAIYTVDEWLTFREGQSALAVVSKGAIGAIWFVITYLVRVYVNLLIEPQVNPIKHFPVVTVSHKILLPMAPTILATLRQPLLPLGAVLANGVAGATVFLLPGVFGFLVWELKENWRLYAQNRAAILEPVRIGHHGETLSGLLVVGFHSGTLPKTFAKLRAAARRGSPTVHALREELEEISSALETFFDRELARLLAGTPRWTSGELSVHAVHVASNRVRVGVALRGERGERGGVAWLHFEEQSGWLVASVAEAGFFDLLATDQRAAMADALAGLYKLAGVELVREQIEALLGAEVHYDVADEGLLVWPGEAFDTELLYPLRGSTEAAPVVRSGAAPRELRTLHLDELVFARQPILWSAWVAAFAAAPRPEPVLRGPSVMIAAGRSARG